MGSASDELTTPLGADRPERRPSPLSRLPIARILSGVLLALAALVGGYVAIVDDPMGGEPHVVVDIAERAPAPASGPAGREGGLALVQEVPPDGRRSTAVAIETASGVSVVRPDGQSAPGSVVIEIPQGTPGAPPAEPGLSRPAGAGGPAAPDPRLLERTRFGLLPRVGEDGARPVDVYARPAGNVPAGAPRVAILVTGMGISQSATGNAIDRLPPEISFAFAPYGGELDRWAARARAGGHELFVQAPMEPFDYPNSDPGPHTLTVNGGEANRDRLHWVLARLSGYVGVVNFMGARLTADEAALRPVLAEVARRGLGFVDDGSSSRSLAPALAAGLGAPAARADVLLDPVADPARIDAALERLEAIARERGLAVGAASALPVTVERIAAWAQAAAERGIALVPVSNALAAGSGG